MESTEEKINQQQAALEKLEADYEANPSDDLPLKIRREKDMLRHLSNTLTGNPKDRAQQKAEFAKESALSKAVRKVPKE